MGMSASQARLLSITARMTDVEFKSQQISNTKIRLADESQQVADDYTKALNKTHLTYNVWSENGTLQKQELNPSNLKTVNMKLVTRDGKDIDEESSQKITSANMYEMILSGQYKLVSLTEKDSQGNLKEISVDGSDSLAIESDTTELAKAEAEYNSKMAKINSKEKLLDNDLKSLDTEHNALKTEHDSIKSLIKDNVTKSFNLFS